MRRILALLAALLWVAPASAESYSMIHAFDVPAGCTAIATTNSDSFQIRSRYGDVDSYDSIYLAHRTGARGFSGDGRAIESIGSNVHGVAIATFGTGYSRYLYKVTTSPSYWAQVHRSSGYSVPLPSQGFAPECYKPLSPIAADARGDFYVFAFAACGTTYEARRYAAESPTEGPPAQTFGNFMDPRYLAVDPWGHLYVTGDGAISKFAADGTQLASWPMADPGAIATDRFGNVFVLDHSSGRARKLTRDGAQLAEWPIWTSTLAIAIGPYDDVYLLDSGGAVEKWRQDQSTPVVGASWGQVKARWGR